MLPLVATEMLVACRDTFTVECALAGRWPESPAQLTVYVLGPPTCGVSPKLNDPEAEVVTFGRECAPDRSCLVTVRICGLVTAPPNSDTVPEIVRAAPRAAVAGAATLIEDGVFSGAEMMWSTGGVPTRGGREHEQFAAVGGERHAPVGDGIRIPVVGVGEGQRAVGR